MKRRTFAAPYLAWAIIFILAPMLLIVYYAFTGEIDGKTVFTMASMAKALDPLFLNVLGHSMLLAAVATLVCLLLGYPIAYILSRMNPRKAAMVSMFFILPMWMNFLLRTYAMMALLDTNGLINNILSAFGFEKVQFLYTSGAVVMGMVYNFLPFMVLPIFNVLQKIPVSNIEAAQDLGANGATVFRKVIFPMSVPGMISGITMCFVPAISTFAISRLLGGSHYMLYGDLIENQFILMRNWNFGSALSMLLLVLVAGTMLITQRYDAGNEGGTLL